MSELIFYSIQLRELEQLIRNCLKAELQNYTPEPVLQDDEFITVNQTCKLLSISKVTCAKWRKEGRIPFYRIGSRVRFKKSEVLNSVHAPKKYGRKEK